MILKIGEKMLSKKFSHKNNLEISKLMEDVKARARETYINNKNEKEKLEIKEKFKNTLKSINRSVLNNLNSYLHEMIIIKNSFSDIRKENEILDFEFSNVNNNVRIINSQILKKTDEISNWQIKFESFKKVMPFYEEIISSLTKENQKKLIINYSK